MFCSKTVKVQNPNLPELLNFFLQFTDIKVCFMQFTEDNRNPNDSDFGQIIMVQLSNSWDFERRLKSERFSLDFGRFCSV